MNDTKSFSFRAKEELARIKLRHQGCLFSEIAAAAQACGSIVISSGKLSIRFSFENPALARRIYGHIKDLTGESPELVLKQHTKLNKAHTYILNIEGQAALPVLKQAGVINEELAIQHTVPAWIKRSCCKRAYFRVLFLAAGSVSAPQKGYHLELTLGDPELAQSVQQQLASAGIKAGIARRKKSYMVYVKDGEAIAELLAFIGAHSAILAYESSRVLKAVRNDVNRAVNCETANVQKTVNAAQRQIGCIRYLIAKDMFKKLPVPLKQAAEARLENPEATLEELSFLMSPKIAKSGMSHRLKKLCEYAEQQGYTN